MQSSCSAHAVSLSSAGASKKDGLMPNLPQVSCALTKVHSHALSWPPMQVLSDIHGSTVQLESPAKKPCLQPVACNHQESSHSQLSPGMGRLGSRDMGASVGKVAQLQTIPQSSSSREAQLQAASAPASKASAAVLTGDGKREATAPGIHRTQAEGKHSDLRSSVLPQGRNA